MKKRNIILSLVLSIAMLLSVMVTSTGAAFTNYAKTTKLFTSYAGYTIHVDDFYNLMKEYVGKKHTYSYNWETGKVDRYVNWNGLYRFDPVYIVTSECKMKADGAIQISQYTQYYYGHEWMGVSITKAGFVNITLAVNSMNGEYTYDLAWNANNNQCTVKVKFVDPGDNIFKSYQNTYNGLETCFNKNDDVSWMADWMADVIREHNWRTLNYTFYVF